MRLEEERLRRIERVSERAHVGASFTRREGQVLALLLEGLDAAGVGEVLGISPVTVRRHTSGLLAKFGARDRQDLLRLVAGDRDADAGAVAG